jgi:hypothetical protein
MLPVGEPVSLVDVPGQPQRRIYEGQFVHLAPVQPERDAAELYPLSHGSDDVEALWTYMPYGPFADKTDMQAWMADIALESDPLFLTVRQQDTNAANGMVSFPASRRRIVAWNWAISGTFPPPSAHGPIRRQRT